MKLHLLLLSLMLFVVVGCAHAPARWATQLENRVSCGMSIEQVEILSEAKLVAISGRGPGGTHFLSKGLTTLWFDFVEGQLVSVRPGWTVAMSRGQWGEKKFLCAPMN